MYVSFAQVKTIMDTLPIGYYAGKRVTVSLEEETPCHTSYYSSMDETIVIDYPLIAKRLEPAPDTANVEEAVRSMLYHEVSHAILTPKETAHVLEQRGNTTLHDVVNIFEDERIETVLANYYHNVNFKKQLAEITAPNQGQDSLSRFFDLVRFHVGDKQWLDEVANLISKYSFLNTYSDYNDTSHYIVAIKDLWYKFNQYQKNNPQSRNNKNQNQQNSIQAKTGINQQDSNDSGDKQEQSNNTLVTITAEQAEEIIQNAMENTFTSNCTKAKRERIKKEAAQFETEANRIFDNFHRKNNSGSGINAYSGIFNPRAVARQDYRYFERAITNNGNNKFGTCHLNCFIDVSGSFSSASPLVNNILAILSKIEKRNRNFTLSVIHINTQWHEATDIRDREFSANDGNDLPSDTKERFNKLQKKNTYVHNLILFDGDAFSYSSKSEKEREEIFSTFDTPTTTLITDDDNEDLCKNFRSAHVIITEHYTDELLKNILLSLQKAFN